MDLAAGTGGFLTEVQAQSVEAENGIHITAWNAARINALSRTQKAEFAAIIDFFGQRSAKAQGLSSAISDLERVVSNGHVLYLAAVRKSPGRTQLLGGLKIGCKRLFLHSPGCDKYLEINPDCVLDFYVHESCQRMGIGLTLLETFLRDSGKTAAMLAYDRPSPKLKALLEKYYGLSSSRPQLNNFVVFDELLEEAVKHQQRRIRPALQVDACSSIVCSLQPIHSRIVQTGRSASAPAAMATCSAADCGTISAPAPQPAGVAAPKPVPRPSRLTPEPASMQPGTPPQTEQEQLPAGGYRTSPALNPTRKQQQHQQQQTAPAAAATPLQASAAPVAAVTPATPAASATPGSILRTPWALHEDAADSLSPRRLRKADVNIATSPTRHALKLFSLEGTQGTPVMQRG